MILFHSMAAQNLRDLKTPKTMRNGTTSLTELFEKSKILLEGCSMW